MKYRHPVAVLNIHRNDDEANKNEVKCCHILNHTCTQQQQHVVSCRNRRQNPDDRFRKYGMLWLCILMVILSIQTKQQHQQRQDHYLGRADKHRHLFCHSLQVRPYHGTWQKRMQQQQKPYIVFLSRQGQAQKRLYGRIQSSLDCSDHKGINHDNFDMIPSNKCDRSSTIDHDDQEVDNENNGRGNSKTLSQVNRRNMIRQGTTVLAGIMTTTTIGDATSTGRRFVANAFDSEENKRIQIFERTSPSVVFIDTFIERRDNGVFSTNIMEVPLGSGSGFVWDKEGHIVTNYHVVRNSKAAQVTILLSYDMAKSAGLMDSNNRNVNNKLVYGTSTLPLSSLSSSSSSLPTSMKPSSGKNSLSTIRKVYTAKIVGLDPGKDIAVLKIDVENPNILFPIAVGTSTGLRVGQQSLAIGNPFGLDHTLTVGVISGTGREVKSPIGRPISDVIQTDAAINPGNSGGPLLDSSGKLIGMNTAIYSPSGASAGIGFAIPIDTVKYIVDILIRDGQIIRPVLGISYLSSKQAKTLGITMGVLVLDVPPGTPPAKAGLKGTKRNAETGMIELGDIIRNVNGVDINTESDLFQALEDCKPGDIVNVTVQRIVAVSDELVVRDVTLQIPLSESTKFEKILSSSGTPPYSLPDP